MQTPRKSAAKRFFQTAVIQAVLMLLEAGLILGCILRPENRVLPLLAGITAMWALVAFGFAFGRFYKHVIRPCTETEKAAQALARGDFPPSLPPRVREFFPELSRSVNLLRDRLQYLESSLRDRQTREQLVRRDGNDAALQSRVYSRLLARLYPPLTLMAGFLELPDPTREEKQAAAGQAHVALRRFGELIRALRTDAGEEAESTFDLSMFLRDFDDAAQAFLQRRAMTLSCSFGAELPVALRGDRPWLERQLMDLLHIAAQESESGRRLELACGMADGTVYFTVADPFENDLAAEFQKSQDADSSAPGGETALSLLELRLASTRARLRQATLVVEEYGRGGSRLCLTLDPSWIAPPEPEHTAGLDRFVESTRHTAPPPAGPETGRMLVVAREPEFAALLAARHPGTEWAVCAPERALPEAEFRRILAVIPAEIAARRLERLENDLCRAALRGASVKVLDPGMHRRFRRHLRECGIRDIADTSALDTLGSEA